MPSPNSASHAPAEAPLISPRFLYRATAIVATLLAATAAISIGGRWLGQRMVLGSNTDSLQEYRITIGEDPLALAANTLRFRDQRHDGNQERVDLALAWPEMLGYSAALKSRFDDVSKPGSLVFLELSESTMSQDMSGRLLPIYEQLFDGAPSPVAFGLTLHHLKGDSGYGREVILTAPRPGDSPYVVRCLLPAQGESPTSGDCQRDIGVGEDLTVLYRFSSNLLYDWQHIDDAVKSYVDQRLSAGRAIPSKSLQPHL